MGQALINAVGFKSAILVNVAVLKRQTGPVIGEARLNGRNLNVLGAPMAHAIEMDVYRQTRMVLYAVQMFTETVCEPPSSFTYICHGATLAYDSIDNVAGHTCEALLNGEGGFRECDRPDLGDIGTSVAFAAFAADGAKMIRNVRLEVTPD